MIDRAGVQPYKAGCRLAVSSDDRDDALLRHLLCMRRILTGCPWLDAPVYRGVPVHTSSICVREELGSVCQAFWQQSVAKANANGHQE
jgi:hypothetical protein